MDNKTSNEESKEEYTSLAQYLENRSDTKASIESLIKQEIRPHKVAMIEFVCGKDEQSTMKSFEQIISKSLRFVQDGLFILLQLPNAITSYKANEIISLLIKFYQIIKDLSSKTHGLSFDATIILIHSKKMYNDLKKQFETIP